MEISIRVVITLFVVFVVGITIIQISSNLLINSKNKVNNISLNNGENQLITKTNFTKKDILLLAEKCYENNNAIKKNKVCYILKSNFKINLSSLHLTNDSSIISLSRGDSKTIYVRYSPRENITISD